MEPIVTSKRANTCFRTTSEKILMTFKVTLPKSYSSKVYLKSVTIRYYPQVIIGASLAPPVSSLTNNLYRLCFNKCIRHYSLK